MARIKIQDMGISIIPGSDPELTAQVVEVMANGEGEIDVEALKVFSGPYRKVEEEAPAPEPELEPEPEFEQGTVVEEDQPKPKSKKKKK